MQITHHCNALRDTNLNQKVSIRGWVDRRRDHGGVIFIDLRDREGKTQIVFNPEHNHKTHQLGESLRNEFVIHIEGTVQSRPEGMLNPSLPTGAIDVLVDTLTILNSSLTPIIEVNDIQEESKEGEEIRFKYRYLDMRRSKQNHLIRLKSRFLHSWRTALHNKKFDEIETPILCKSTPEGARDFLVPSRLHSTEFYALPQSPQTYKQLLMISGFEKYYQIAKCFRDEDLRADRQPEFLQIDCEMSFVECEDIYSEFEEMISQISKEIWNKEVQTPFMRLPYSEAMLKYGSDKPDLRYNLEIKDVSHIAQTCDFKVFCDVVNCGGVVRGLAAKGCVDFTRKMIDDLTAYVGLFGAKGLVWMRQRANGIESQVAKFLKPEQIESLSQAISGESGDMLFFIAGSEKIVANAIGKLRSRIAKEKKLTEGKEPVYLWVTEFPMFEYSETEKRYTSMHHPFTAPREEDLTKLEQGNFEKAIAKAYDLVLNGVEIGGGSIRIHKPEQQTKIFNLLGLSKEDIKQKFGYFIEAFQYGAPPHGGIAFGVDRFLATMENRESIRDFIPFPKNSSGIAPMENSPSEVHLEQLQELSIQPIKKIYNIKKNI